MSDKTCRKIATVISIAAAILTLINVILSVKNVDTKTLEDSNRINQIFEGLLFDAAGEQFYTNWMYVVCVIAVFAEIILMAGSYFMNNGFGLGITMIVCRSIQLVMLTITWIIGWLKCDAMPGVKTPDVILNMGFTRTWFGDICLLGIAVLELVIFILYMIDGSNRMKFIKLGILSVWTLLGTSLLIVLLYGSLLFIILFVVMAKLHKPTLHIIDEETGHHYRKEWY